MDAARSNLIPARVENTNRVIPPAVRRPVPPQNTGVIMAEVRQTRLIRLRQCNSVLCAAQRLYLPVVARCIMRITVRAGTLARCYDGFRNLLAMVSWLKNRLALC